MNLIAITNPSDKNAQAGFVHTQTAAICVEKIIPEYGDRIEDGAQIVVVSDGASPRVWQYIAERCEDKIWIRTNDDLNQSVDTVNVGPCVAFGDITPLEPVELHTYTVFGWDDDGQEYTYVCTAESPEQAAERTKAAVVVDPGYENQVSIDLILSGDHSDTTVSRV